MVLEATIKRPVDRALVLMLKGKAKEIQVPVLEAVHQVLVAVERMFRATRANSKPIDLI